ncbi:SMI1/KNR4 family protein [Paenibacillus sp. PK3_47]|uniref:SMI1/KNR4 family protein n=1 Tax=Paenibacillus sp. PK3_47 TaxID=2072642 RepID=UPI00201D4CFE|nr:SMI1/KNR4 family protein [Paenibacillus sp. PK3_47]
MSVFHAKDDCRLIRILKEYIPDVEDLLNPAAGEAEITGVEELIGFRFPDEFKNLYLRHNGEGDQVFGVMSGLSWMNLQSAAAAWRGFQDSAYDIVSGRADAVKEGEYRKGWVPFAEDGGGSFLVMDLEPAAKGSYGQIITLDRNSDISYVLADSLEQFFGFIESGFRNGEIRVTDGEEVMLIERRHGHLFDDVAALTQSDNETNSLIPVSGFWAAYFAEEMDGGYISAAALSKQRMVFIKADAAGKYGAVSLDFLTRMPNLKELIIHAAEIINYDVFKQLPSLTKLVIGGKSFKESGCTVLAVLGEFKGTYLNGPFIKRFVQT